MEAPHGRFAEWLLCMAVCAQAASAQETATWLWDVTTDDGDALVEPGETATITMSLDMQPDVDWETVLGFSGATFDVLGSDGAANGSVLDWEILNDLEFASGPDESFLDGASILNIEAAQVPFGPFKIDDPLDVLEFHWATDDFGDYAVTYESSTANWFTDELVEGKVDVLVDPDGDNLGQLALWDAVETSVTFQVVPAPGGVLVFLIGAGAMVRRRR